MGSFYIVCWWCGQFIQCQRAGAKAANASTLLTDTINDTMHLTIVSSANVHRQITYDEGIGRPAKFMT